jgi:hypothetical protein
MHLHGPDSGSSKSLNRQNPPFSNAMIATQFEVDARGRRIPAPSPHSFASKQDQCSRTYLTTQELRFADQNVDIHQILGKVRKSSRLKFR